MKKLLLLGVVLAIAVVLNALVMMRPARRAAPEQPLSSTQRAALDDRMFRHGDDLTDLLSAIVARDHGTAARLADALSSEAVPRMPAETPVSSRFLQLHDEMRARAREVSAAAAAHDDARLTSAYGRLAGSCVDCHRAYPRGAM